MIVARPQLRSTPPFAAVDMSAAPHLRSATHRMLLTPAHFMAPRGRCVSGASACAPFLASHTQKNAAATKTPAPSAIACSGRARPRPKRADTKPLSATQGRAAKRATNAKMPQRSKPADPNSRGHAPTDSPAIKVPPAISIGDIDSRRRHQPYLDGPTVPAAAAHPRDSSSAQSWRASRPDDRRSTGRTRSTIDPSSEWSG